MTGLWVQSAAKINLVLNVLGKRTDGYHELQMVMQSVSLYDTLELVPADTLRLTAPAGITNDPQQNLVYQAAALLCQKYQIKQGVQITLRKNIPLASGLAGGSTDCAGVLLGLDQFFGLNRPVSELADIANLLGSDTAYCLYGGSYIAQGRGEILQKLPELPELYGLILKPPFSLSTATVYNKAVTGKNSSLKLKRYLTGKVSLANLQNNMQNDLIKPALLLQPELADYFKMVESTNPTAWQMSGSGPSIFAFYKDQETRNTAVTTLRRLTNEPCQIFPVETTNIAQIISET
ncbi:4-diphosphocytidyl-2C-methyl-D-erythritol kinase [Candidatus Termititenax dinenymphae]|uniref:4-diphosphocytidyl-2-C-methyl-D-erythritol kinase n=1 Tax=Candidatus Termititenax dinenymphae TaxID=2218523 RepID=A0A388TKN4_9BACT|nr:4-diphosphocytidyl-2C-methyl-D-erythritol kinase [Candidatus Termititenax dinenymphae]